MPMIRSLFASAAALLLAAAPAAGPGYHVTARHTLGGDGGWDYLALDGPTHRLFIARDDRVMVVDPATGKLLAEIPGFDRAHGVAFADAAGHAFATSGGDSTVRMIDLKTLKVIGKTHAAVDDDGILYDPYSRHIFTMNGDAGSSSVIDAVTGRNLGTIDLQGKPEFGVSDGQGHVFVNIESKGAVDEVDVTSMKVLKQWSIAPCESPTGLAIDVAHHRLFSGCRNGLMGISDAAAGKLVGTAPIGRGVDATRFDPGTQLAFASNGDGTLTVIHEDSPDKYTVVQTVTTMDGARTMELDPVTHTLYTVSAEFGPRPSTGRGRPPVKPGTFTLLTLTR